MIDHLTKSEPSPVPVMPMQTIEGLAAWRGMDFGSSSDFTHRLTDAEIAEIDAAVRAIAERRIDHIAIDRHNFELPQFGKHLTFIRDGVLLRGQGFMVIRGLPVERYSIEQAAAAFLGIGAYFGKPVSQNGKGHILGHVKDLGRSIDDPTARIYQTTHKQTFHTDSVDIVALLCLKTAKSGGLSRIVSSMFLYNEMFRRRPDLAAVLFEPMMRLLPALYGWARRRKISRLYDELRLLEDEIQARSTPPDAGDMVARLDRLEQQANQLRLPIGYASMLYMLRHHIDLARQRLKGQ